MFDSEHPDRDLLVFLNFTGVILVALVIAQHFWFAKPEKSDPAKRSGNLKAKRK